MYAWHLAFHPHRFGTEHLKMQSHLDPPAQPPRPPRRHAGLGAEVHGSPGIGRSASEAVPVCGSGLRWGGDESSGFVGDPVLDWM